MSLLRPIHLLVALMTSAAQAASPGAYVVETLPIPAGIKMEASGLAVLPNGHLAVATRNGDVWIVPMGQKGDGAVKRFASGLHEPLGLAWHQGSLYATQRSEVTRMTDTDGDGTADDYSTFAKGWGVSGNYHEYAYGPVFDPKGNAWITLNINLGARWPEGMPKDAPNPWRGWCMMIPPGGKMEPIACGFRSPCGIGQNLEGDVFATDQQGNWIPAGPLVHLRKGAFYGHADSLVDATRPESPVKPIPGKIREDLTVAQAITQVPGYAPPAVWFPYVKMGQSTTGVTCDTTQGKFGPFAGQVFVGEFAMSAINRVFMEKVGGEYQGACFPFLGNFDCAVLQMTWLPDGSMIVGETNRGWNSLGTRSFGLQKVRWNGKTPFEILKMEALADGFRFTFTQPLQPASAKAASFEATSYTYLHHSKYGSPEVETQPVEVAESSLSPDKRSIVVKCAGLRAGYVHEFHLAGIRSEGGQPLVHKEAYYTLNRLP